LPCPLDGLRLLRAGLLLGEVAKGRFIPAHALAMAAGVPLRQRVELSEPDALKYLHGETLPTDASGWCAVTHRGLALGLGKGAGGVLKNHLPKGLRMF
ncbi:MAG: RsmF rRNA methyltransferase first C-terminal domain-containing protein, partial [Clostridia bacterium]|nr:RsmF rRNA methyltransferase first C-terminal domain-containing protein [Clostridia bacterium]